MTLDWQQMLKTQVTKKKVDKFDYLKSKNLCALKDC